MDAKRTTPADPERIRAVLGRRATVTAYPVAGLYLVHPIGEPTSVLAMVSKPSDPHLGAAIAERFAAAWNNVTPYARVPQPMDCRGGDDQVDDHQPGPVS